MMKTIWLILITMVMGSGAATAQNDSPCNQGRDPDHDPRNPYAICLPEIGRMDGPTTGGGFGNQLAPVGDVDNSGTIDFVVGHGTSRRGEELLLYKGVMGGLPALASGQRICPADTNSITGFIAAGDWDGDGHIDIAVWMQILGDTSEGNSEGYDISRQVIFGNYILSTQDRTFLS